MWQYIVKVVLTAVIVVAVSEVGKRNSFWAAALASLPLTSLLAFVWIYLETGDAQRVAMLSQDILWLVIPSLALFVVLPFLLRSGLGFWPSLIAACAATGAAYFTMIRIVGMFGERA